MPLPLVSSTSISRPLIVPLMVLGELAVESAHLSDDLMQLVRVIGQVAERQGEPKILDWLGPYIMACYGRLSTMQDTLQAIIAEQPNSTEAPRG